MIRKAKVKKSYNKLKERELLGKVDSIPTTNGNQEAQPATLELHPDRQAMLDEPSSVVRAMPISYDNNSRPQRIKRPKKAPFEKESRIAQQRKEEAEEREKAFHESNRQRQEKFEERERFRKAMAKARVGGKNGQRKLGRESKVLLEKVKRVMNE